MYTSNNHNYKQSVTPGTHRLQHLMAGIFKSACVVYFKDLFKGTHLIASWSNKFIFVVKGV